MRLTFDPRYRQDTDMAAEAMISEGGALRQPPLTGADAAIARAASKRRGSSRFPNILKWLDHPSSMFWIGCATGLALAILDRRRCRARYLNVIAERRI